MPTNRPAITLLAQPLSLDQVLDQHPALCDNGFDVFEARRKSPGIRDAELREARQALRDRADHVALVVDLLHARVRPVKTCKAHSYTVKHRVENELGAYTTNGELIAAALMAGYPFKRDGDGPNLLLGMSLVDVDALPRV